MASHRVSDKTLRNPTFFKLLLNFPKMLRLVYRLIKDPRVPTMGKLAVFFSLAYLISPIDLIPDFFLPVFGYTDDLAIVLACIRFLMNSTPKDVLEDHFAEIDAVPAR